MNTVKLVSGGIDSYIMSQQYEGTNVYINFGQRYAAEEIAALKKLGVEFDTINIDSKFTDSEIYVNDRNLAFATIIAMIYSPDTIMMAGLKDDNCKDKTEAAFAEMSDVISRFANKRIEVVSPYWTKTKGDIIQEFSNKEKLVDTFSCYTPKDGKPCCNCPACLRRIIALETNGVKTGLKLSKEIIRKYLSKIHQYDTDRISRFFIYLKKEADVVAVDIDGVLCKEDSKPYSEKEPIPSDIARINEMTCYKVLYTARLESDREITEQWLRKHSVKYDSLIMNKLPFTLLIDDKTSTK